MAIKFKKRVGVTTSIPAKKQEPQSSKKTQPKQPVKQPVVKDKTGTRPIVNSKSKDKDIHGNTIIPIKKGAETLSYKQLVEQVASKLSSQVKKEVKEAVKPVTQEIRTVAKAATQAKTWIENKDKKALLAQTNEMRDKLIRDIMRSKNIDERHFAGIRGKLLQELRSKGIRLGIDKKQIALFKDSTGKKLESLKLETFVNQAIAAKGLSLPATPPKHSPGPLINLDGRANSERQAGNFADTIKVIQNQRLKETASLMT